MLQFQYKELIYLFAGLAVFGWLFFRLLYWKKRTTKKIGDPKLVSALTADFSSRRFNIKFILLAVAFAAGVLAVMNLRKPGGEENINRKGIDVAIALDVSKSMLATDLAPNRLERAKQFIGKLVESMPNDRIALVVFAGKAYMQMPLTVDHGATKLFVSSASPSTVAQQGTVLSEALQMSANVFSNTDRRYKAVILITDGEDHDPKAVETATDLSQEGIMINTVGIGSPEGTTFTDPATGSLKVDELGNTVITKLNETGLQEMAKETNGVYVRLESSDEAINTLKQHLSQIERNVYGDVSQMSFKTFYPWFAGLMLLLLLAEQIFPERKRVKK